MLVSLTVGKVDAGVAVLLTEDKRLIEFPSILLPSDIHSGSIVDINVSRNLLAETRADTRFHTLQDEIYTTFGHHSPSPPVLRCRNATQTSVVLEWDPLSLATATQRSLSLYRNGTKAGVIPKDKLSTKISGLAIDTEYTFHLVLRTSAGTYTSERLTVRTHKLTDLSGITVTPGVMPPALRESLSVTAERVGARVIESVRIDTTHFVCTEPRGAAWEKAVELNVPVVVPDWLKGCEREGRIVGVRGYYLDADPKLRQMGPSQTQLRLGGSSPTAIRESPRIEHTPPTPERATAEERHREEPVRHVAVAQEDDEYTEDEEDADEEKEQPVNKPGQANESQDEHGAKINAEASDGDNDDDDDDDGGEGDGKFDEVAL